MLTPACTSLDLLQQKRMKINAGKNVAPPPAIKTSTVDRPSTAASTSKKKTHFSVPDSESDSDHGSIEFVSPPKVSHSLLSCRRHSRCGLPSTS